MVREGGCVRIDNERIPSTVDGPIVQHRAAVMQSVFVVQQRDRQRGRWTTVSGGSTHTAATGLADELRLELDNLPSRPQVRVVSTEDLAVEARISGNAAAILRRCPPVGYRPDLG